MQEKAERRSRETMLKARNKRLKTKWKHSDYKGKRANKRCLAARGDASKNEHRTSMKLQARHDNQRTYNVTLRSVRATIVAVEKKRVLHNARVCVCVCVCVYL